MRGCKHIRAGWSTKGLENIMWLLLMVGHVEPDRQEKFWNGHQCYTERGAFIGKG
ncbi:MAG: hypothetical protein JRN10_05675 [Nitrososphaerota archaeon]|jgi:hypothetical protein|nr:hypothetical protein [Nitrososphaerota archaeon]MDG7037993.1 hypothetical protein [Nitrososphaerota archaeon]MDG7040965.1 hypothetical protein [Nitrososphaerota archaeon]MDG7046815.1 hypothetical protein [Nitrososphaerota archaeon]